MKISISIAVAALLSSEEVYAIKVVDNTPRSSEEFSLKELENTRAQSLAQHSSDEEEDKSKPAPDNTPLQKELNKEGIPQITFRTPHDHVGHTGVIVDQDAARIGFHRTKKTEGPYCMEDDWAILRYKMWSQQDGQLLENTFETEYNKPKIGLVGAYELPKCLDLAVQMMKQGEEATIKCPNDLDIGGSFKNNWHPHLSQVWINDKIDTKYTLTVSECSRKPSYFVHDDKREHLTEGFPFFFESVNKNEEGESMCLQVDPTDLYAPRKTGVHNVKLQICSPKENPHPMQKFIWSAEEESLKSIGVPGSALFEGFNRNIITYKWRGLHNQRFHYNIGTERFQNKFTGFALDIKNDKIQAGQNLLTHEPDQTIGQKWKIVYLGKHGHDHEHEA